MERKARMALLESLSATSRESAADDHEVLFEISPDLLATFDREGRFRRVNGSWERVLGWQRSQLIGRKARDLIHPDDRTRTEALRNGPNGPATEVAQFENRYRCRDGSYRWLEWNARREGGTWYAVARDVTGRRELEANALADPLTGAANRLALRDRLLSALARLRRSRGVVGLLFMDLDRFKVINDSRGHEFGDGLLREAAGRLAQTVRESDTVARFGGDEFVILVEGLATPRDVCTSAERVVAAFGQPFEAAGDRVELGASVGVAATSDPDTSPESLLREADIAMYRAKARGGACWELFDEEVRERVEARLRLERELRAALELAQLTVHYQPIVSVPELSVIRCEALVRWAHPERGLLLPEEFVPLAEESGLIAPIGELVLRQACAQARAWRLAGHQVGVTVNVAIRQLADPFFPALVERVLRETRLPASALCLEVTETAMIEHAEGVASGLHAVRRLGCPVAIDDFGSGYSSLSYLRTLPVDIIKIDRSFVTGVLESNEDRALVAAIVSLARETQRSVIAEGVETEVLHAEVARLGCTLGQGFLYAYPQPPEELELRGYSSRVTPGIGDPLMIREFMRQIGIPARIEPAPVR